MPTAHCVSNTQGIILAADRAFLDLVGRPEHDVVGASYRTFTHPDDFDKSSRLLTALVDRAPPLRLRKRYLRPDGSSISALLFVTCFANPDRLVTTLFWHEAGSEMPPERLWEAALRIQHVRTVRRAAFGDELTTDPVGAILVAIYLAEAEGRIVAVEQLAREAQLSAPTTARWIKALQQRDVVQRNDDADSNVQFTQSGMLDMERTLESVFHLPRSLSDLP
ncbi:MAG: PAS domain-containing protein [Janthinobacterium lividum]